MCLLYCDVAAGIYCSSLSNDLQSFIQHHTTLLKGTTHLQKLTDTN